MGAPYTIPISIRSLAHPSDPTQNLAARSQDIAIYLCPSDPSTAVRGADPNNINSPTPPEGRLNYFGCMGATAVGLFGYPRRPGCAGRHFRPHGDAAESTFC